jgi:hypothetical protein
VKKFFDWTIMGGAIIISRSPKTTRNEKNFQDRPIFFYFLNLFDPLTAAEMALCGNLGAKCQKIFPLVSD